MAVSKKPRNEAVQRERAIDDFISQPVKKEIAAPETEGTKPSLIYWEPGLLNKVDEARKKRGGVSRSAYVQMLVARALEQGEG